MLTTAVLNRTKELKFPQKSHKRKLAMMHALALMSGHNFFCERYNPNSVNPYEPPKLTGFTQVKGRRRLTKKQRKQLKNKK